MSLVLADRVREGTTTTGTDSVTLTGAVTGFQSFSSGVGNGNTTYYTIASDTQWEVGIGTYSAGTLSRDTVLGSSTGSKVNFIAGFKDVFVTLPAEKVATSDTSVTSVTGTAPVVSSGGLTPAISMAKATGSIDGYLSSTDWTTFNSKGNGTVTSVAASGTVNGITLTGGPITSSGTITLGGTLDLSSPPAIGATTPSTGTFTTLTAQTEVLKGTGQNLLTYSNTFSNAFWTKDAQTLTASQSDPFGGSAATLFVPTVTNTSHNIYNGIGIVAGCQYTLSVYVKASGYTLFYISDVALAAFSCSYNLTAVTATPVTGCSATITAVSGATGWYRLTLTTTGTLTTSSRFNFTPYVSGATLNGYNATFAGDGTSGAVIYGAQLEIGSTANTYVATSGTAVYGTPTLSFSGVAGIGLQSDGSLYVQPAGTGALQAQKTDSTATGGNARGANAVDWQTTRSTAAQVASGVGSFIGAGTGNTASGPYSSISSGQNSTASSTYSVAAGGGNTASGNSSSALSGYGNTAAGFYNVIVGGYTNSGTANGAVTTQSGTMNATTAVTLSGSNASIKVGQYITGTSIASFTYVAAVSGTSLTLSQNASGSSTSTLSFFTPHGVVVGGGNNQATGSYSFIGGGGDAGTAANRNVASGDWSFVGGGSKNTASGTGSFIGGGGTYGSGVSGNTSSGTASFVGGGIGNTASNSYASVVGGEGNFANGTRSVVNGSYGSARGIAGVIVNSYNGFSSFSAGTCQNAIYVLQAGTTDATAKVATVDGSAAGSTNQVILPNNSAYYFRGEIIAGVTGAGNTKGWYIEGVIKRGANAASTALVGTPTVMSAYADAGAVTWAITATADTTNGGLAITVTGQASTTIRWVAQIRTTEMTY